MWPEPRVLGLIERGKADVDYNVADGLSLEWARGPRPGALPRPVVSAPVVGVAPWQWCRRPETRKLKTNLAKCMFQPTTPAGRSAETERRALGAACVVGPVGAAPLGAASGQMYAF